MLTLKNICFGYESSTPLLDNISTTIHPGQITAIAGRNGSGKSTFTRLLMGLLQLTSGSIHLKDLDITTKKPQEISQYISYVFQNAEQQLFCSTVFDEVAYALQQRKINTTAIKEQVNSILTQLDLNDYALELPQMLSIDQKQRLTIACALVTNPQFLILDEPTSGQDCRQRTRLLRLIQKLKARGLGIILVTHDMDIIAEHADKILVLHQGKLAFDGTCTNLFSNADLTASLGLDLPESVRISQELGLKLSLTPQELYAQLSTNNQHFI